MVAPAQNILTPAARLPFVDPKTGMLTIPALQLLQQHAQALTGGVPSIPSTATHASNVFTLTPYSNSPQFANYFDFQPWHFMAPATSTGLVTATVVPLTGVLPTLPVYKNNGGTQANSGDIVANRIYTAMYHSGLNSGNGGFVLS
jgi:hypothetical protein